MIDYTKMIEKLFPQTDGEDVLRRRTGVIDAINADGTVDLLLSTVLVENVPVLEGVTLVIGRTVETLSFRGFLLVIGVVRSTDDPVLKMYDRVTSGVPSTTTAGDVAMEVDLPAPGTYVFDLLWILTNTLAVGRPGWSLAGTSTPTAWWWGSSSTHYNTASGSQGFGSSGTSYPSTVTALVNSDWTTTTGWSGVVVKGGVTVSAAGTLQFKIGKATGTGNTITAHPGSAVTVDRVQ